MSTFFIPYAGRRPAALDINGHRLVIVSPSRGPIEESLEFFGADRVRSLKVANNPSGHEAVLGRMAKRVGGGVVVAPPDVGIEEVVRNLHTQLPWLQ
ncbi:MAG: hypothetical protein K1X79_04705 [Oligoflexia bacterium]|nr:hypothetical protein [Oligoflexia bacterium]